MGAGKSSSPLVFLHGGPGGSSFQFEQTAAKRLAQEFTVVVYDQRGCGRTQSPEDDDYSIESLTQDLEGLRQELGSDKLVLLGSSFGGEIAMSYALRYPDHVRFLLLEGPSNGDHFALMEMQYLNFQKIAPDPIKRRLSEIWSKKHSLPERYFKIWSVIDKDTANRFIFHDEKYARIVRKIWDSQSWGSNQKMAEVIWKKPPVKPFLYERMRNLKIPVLILVGKYDFNTGLPLSHKIKENSSNAKLVVFNNSGHFPDLEETELFKTTISEFVQRH